MLQEYLSTLQKAKEAINFLISFNNILQSFLKFIYYFRNVILILYSYKEVEIFQFLGERYDRLVENIMRELELKEIKGLD
jgi:hypothetical protein